MRRPRAAAGPAAPQPAPVPAQPAPAQPGAAAGGDPRSLPVAAVAALEPGQIAAIARRPVPRAPLSRSARLLLCALRLFVLLLSAAVVYAFLVQL